MSIPSHFSSIHLSYYEHPVSLSISLSIYISFYLSCCRIFARFCSLLPSSCGAPFSHITLLRLFDIRSCCLQYCRVNKVRAEERLATGVSCQREVGILKSGKMLASTDFEIPGKMLASTWSPVRCLHRMLASFWSPVRCLHLPTTRGWNFRFWCEQRRGWQHLSLEFKKHL